MVQLFWMMQNLGVCKGFFMMKAAASHDGVHTKDEVHAFIYITHIHTHTHIQTHPPIHTRID